MGVLGTLKRCLGERLGRLALGGCAAVLLTGTPALADDVETLKARLDRLEQQNANLLKIIQEGGITPAQAATAPKAEVEKIVKDYLDKKTKDEADKKKKDEEAGYEVGKDLTFKPMFRDGLYFETGDKAFKAALRGRWHNDWGWAEADAPNPVGPFVPGVPNSPVHPTIVDPTRDLDDGVIFRRGRLGIQGTLWEVHDFVAEFEFAGGSIAFREIWMGMNQIPYIGTFKAGHFKEFFSLEQLTSSRYLTFIERSIIDGPVDDNLAYNTGVAIHNTCLDEHATWAVGMFRHTDATGNDAGDGDYNFTGRVTVLPMYQHNGRCLLHLGAAASYRQPAGSGAPGRDAVQDFEQWRTRPYRVDPVAFLGTGNLFMSDYQAYGLEALLIYGPFSLQAEYHRWDLNDIRFSQAGQFAFDDATYDGYYVYATYTLTGENRAYSRTSGTISRLKPYEPAWVVNTEEACGWRGICCGKGAWEIAARYAHLNLSDGRFGTPGAAGVLPNTGELDQYTLGLNWYWSGNMKVQWNYELFNMDRTGSTVANAHQNDGSIQSFVMRFAWDF